MEEPVTAMDATVTLAHAQLVSQELTARFTIHAIIMAV